MMMGLAIGPGLPPDHPSGTISAIPDRRVPLLAVALWQDRSVRLDAIE
jgi:hypothetical protein